MTDAQKIIYNFLTKIILDSPANYPKLIAISGKDASGKTVMADLLAKYLKKQTNR